MSIDIKTLHIGSHVTHHGKRKRVHCIVGDTVYLLPSSASSVAHMATTTEIEPIPIDSEVLMMLGFLFRKTTYREYYTKEIGEVRCRNIHGYEYRDRRITFYRMKYRNKVGERWHCSLSVYMGSAHGNETSCRYLHEAEAFLALHGVELK